MTHQALCYPPPPTATSSSPAHVTLAFPSNVPNFPCVSIALPVSWNALLCAERVVFFPTSRALHTCCFFREALPHHPSQPHTHPSFMLYSMAFVTV